MNTELKNRQKVSKYLRSNDESTAFSSAANDCSAALHDNGTELQPYYQDSFVKIYCGDALKVLLKLKNEPKGGVVITDPPYGNALYESDKPIDIKRFWKLIKNCTTKSIFGYPETLVKYSILLKKVPDEWVTWWPTNKIIARSKYLSKESECIAIWGNVVGSHLIKRERTLDKWARRVSVNRGLDPNWALAGDVWTDYSPGTGVNNHKRLHSNEKPVSLMRKLILLTSVECHTILDPFMGVGTTLLAAKQLNRKSIGIEIEEKYCEIAALRLQQQVLDFSECEAEQKNAEQSTGNSIEKQSSLTL